MSHRCVRSSSGSAPGTGKSALVAKFADAVGIACISLLGSQLALEDLIGVPQIVGGKSRFAPPIAREEPHCLFLDELNARSHEVQKAFSGLIHERLLGYETLMGAFARRLRRGAQRSGIRAKSD